MVYRSGLLRAYDSNNLPNPTASDRRGSHEPGEGILRHTQTAKQDVLQKPFFRSVWPDRPTQAELPPHRHADTICGSSGIRLRQHFSMLSTQHALCNEDNDSMLLAETASFTLSLMVYRSGLWRVYDSNTSQIRRRLTGGVLTNLVRGS